MTVLPSPWRFLTPLSGDNPDDLALIDATRGTELRMIEDMVAASRASILYAYSGNGKTSLINAGVVPRLRTLGYAVFLTRPRPPWGANDPLRAFKEGVIRSLAIPLFDEADVAALREARARVDRSSEAGALGQQLRRVEERMTAFRVTSQNVVEARDQLRQRMDAPLTEFLTTLQTLVGDSVKLLFVCDQFEELFVHFADTRHLERFVGELGAVWRHDALRARFLFSMREDWVGSMIALRDAVPEVFGAYFRLGPLRASAARQALTHPLGPTGLAFPDDAVGLLLHDLSRLYAENQRERYGEVRYTPSPSNDPFIELPALQVVADQLWRSRDATDPPFSTAHYAGLKRDREALDSPAGWVLEHYLPEQLNDVAAPNGGPPEFWRDLRIDCLFELTDKSRHRRALTETDLLDEVNRERRSHADVGEVDREALCAAIDPLVERRLVLCPDSGAVERQFELAHDFAVRSVVREWRGLDRRRASDRAIRDRHRVVEDRKFAALKQHERRAGRFVQLAPLVGMIVLLLGGLFSSALLPGMVGYRLPLVAALIYAACLPFAVQARYRWTLAGSLVAVAWLFIVPAVTSFILQYHYLLLAGILLLLYPPAGREVAAALDDPAIVQRRWAVMWAELWDIAITLGLLAGGVWIFALVKENPTSFFHVGIVAMVILALSSWWVAAGGKTIGYALARLPIQSPTGGRPSWAGAITRQGASLVWTALNLLLALPWLFVTPVAISLSPKPQNWPDSLAGTLVGGIGAPAPVQTAPGAKQRPARRALIFASLLVILVVMVGVLPPFVARTQEGARIASMKGELRNLMTAEEAFFADSIRYGSRSELTNYFYSNNYAVTVAVEAWGGTGWRGLATHYDSRKRCYVAVGPYVLQGEVEADPFCTEQYIPPPVPGQ